MLLKEGNDLKFLMMRILVMYRVEIDEIKVVEKKNVVMWVNIVMVKIL